MLPPAIHSFPEQRCHDNPHVTGYKHTTSLQGFALGKAQTSITHSLFWFWGFFWKPRFIDTYFVQDASNLPANFIMWQQISSAKMGQRKVWRTQEKGRYNHLIKSRGLHERISLPKKATASLYLITLLKLLISNKVQETYFKNIRHRCSFCVHLEL